MKRYDLMYSVVYADYAEMTEVPDGDWVRFEDVEEKIIAYQEEMKKSSNKVRELQAKLQERDTKTQFDSESGERIYR